MTTEKKSVYRKKITGCNNRDDVWPINEAYAQNRFSSGSRLPPPSFLSCVPYSSKPSRFKNNLSFLELNIWKRFDVYMSNIQPQISQVGILYFSFIPFLIRSWCHWSTGGLVEDVFRGNSSLLEKIKLVYFEEKIIQVELLGSSFRHFLYFLLLLSTYAIFLFYFHPFQVTLHIPLF